MRKNTQRTANETGKSEGGFFYNYRYTFLAFLLPAALMVLAFKTIGIYPFGDNQVMVVDMWHQYYPFLNELHEKLISFDSLLYTWNTGLGTNFIALIAYYAASPLYLLSIFWPTEYLTEFLALCIVLKIAFSGAFFSIFLKGMYKRTDLSTVAFSTLYALCAYAMGYYWNIMWLDCVALFPLIMLGFNKLMDEGKYKLFTFSLAVALISNYYIGTFICMFIAIYYLIAYYSRYSNSSFKFFVKKTGSVLFFSVIGVAIACVIVIPTFFALQNASAATNEFPGEWKFYKPWLDILNNLLVGVKPTVRGGMANIYCGLLSVLLFFVYAFNKKINIRERVLHISFLGFMLLTFNLNQLDFIFHGFHFPNELPHRYSFIFSFFLVAMAYKAFTLLDSVKVKQISVMLLGGLFYILIINRIYGADIPTDAINYSILFLILYCTAFLIYITGKIKEASLCILIFFFVIGEGVITTQKSVLAVGHSNRTSYRDGMAGTKELVAMIESKDNGFYRIENTAPYTINPSALYTFKGVSQFSSSANSKVSDLMNKLGFAGNIASNRYTYHRTTPVADSMLSLKYLINRSGTTESEFLNFYENSGNSNAYSYKYFLPIGFMVSHNIRAWDTDNQNKGNPFKVQSDFISKATGLETPVFNEIAKIDSEYTNIDVTESGQSYSYNQVDSSQPGKVSLTYVVDRPQTVYGYLSAYRAVDGNAVFKRNDMPTSQQISYPHIAEIGRCETGDVIKMEFDVEAAAFGSFTAFVYGIDNEAFEKAHSLLNDEPFNVTEYSSTGLKGSITAKEDGVFYTSIPYEKGWSIKVDGKTVKAKPVQNAFLAFDLSEGTHKVELSFIPHGFIYGLILTLLSLGMMIFFIVLERKGKKIPYVNNLLEVSEEDGTGE